MNKNRYNEFKKTENWNSRFIWTGLYNNSKYANLSVINFLREIKPFESISNINNINKFWSLVDKIGIKYLTVYAFSTENWKRSKEEVGALMLLLQNYLDDFAKRADTAATAGKPLTWYFTGTCYIGMSEIAIDDMLKSKLTIYRSSEIKESKGFPTE